MANATDIRQGTIIRIVDDDDDIRDALGFMLECKGWQVRAYASARDFLTQDSPSIPGCLLLDIRMPDMSGVQLQTHEGTTHTAAHHFHHRTRRRRNSRRHVKSRSLGLPAKAR